MADSTFHGQRRSLGEKLKFDSVDLNSLDATGKNAAESIVGEGKAKLVTARGRLTVVGRKPNNPLLRFLTVGLRP